MWHRRFFFVLVKLLRCPSWRCFVFNERRAASSSIFFPPSLREASRFPPSSSPATSNERCNQDETTNRGAMENMTIYILPWRVLSSWMQCRVVRWKSVDVSEDHVASHLQSQRISQASRHCCLLHADFLRGVFLKPKDGGDMFFRNVSWLSTDYTVLYPRRQNIS
jgi:hypothetical protein